MVGVSLSDGAFDRIIKDPEDYELFSPIILLAYDGKYKDPELEAISKTLPPNFRRELVDKLLPGGIMDIYYSLREERPLVKSLKTGRNDACPCGSGSASCKAKLA